MKKIFYILTISLLFFAGCITVEKTIECQTTEPWENHYFTVKEFKEKTQNIELKDRQSIWVLSNDTLKRILKDVSK